MSVEELPSLQPLFTLQYDAEVLRGRLGLWVLDHEIGRGSGFCSQSRRPEVLRGYEAQRFQILKGNYCLHSKVIPLSSDLSTFCTGIECPRPGMGLKAVIAACDGVNVDVQWLLGFEFSTIGVGMLY